MTLLAREDLEVDALATDGYLDALLAARDRGAEAAPADIGVDPSIRFAAGRLAARLERVHPSFRFEERLAARLAAQADHMTAAAHGAAAAGEPASFPAGLRWSIPASALDPARPEARVLVDRRGLIVGGTIASAAISIVGAAFVAWRRSRPSDAGPASSGSHTPRGRHAPRGHHARPA